MKGKLKKLLSTMLIAIVALTLVQIPAEASVNTSGCQVSFTGYTADTVSISWTAPAVQDEWYSFATYDYDLDYYYIEINNNIIGYVSPTETSTTITGLGKGWTGTVYVYAHYTETIMRANGSGDTSSSGTRRVGYVRANTTPGNASVKSISPYSNGDIYFSANKPTNASGVQFQIRNASGKVVKTVNTSFSTTQTLKKNYGYKVRVRAYYTNTGNNKTYYGKWSGYKYFDNLSYTYTSSTSNNYITLKLKKGAGITGYDIYVSTKKDSGYKKYKTVTVPGKTRTLAVTKYGTSALKKGNTYYVRVVPRVKNGKSYKKSVIYGYGSCYMSRY